MALLFYIDDFQIQEPDGFIGATFESGVNEKYYGDWQSLGLNAGSGNGKIKFTEDTVVNYIKKKVLNEGVKAEIIFKFVDDCATNDCNSALYKIDLTDYSEKNCCEVDVSFKAIEGDSIRNKIINKASVIANSTLFIKRLNGISYNYKGVYLKDAIQQILTQFAPEMVLVSDWLDNCNNIFLTNGFNLRGFTDKPLILSLDSIFAGINPSENIEYAIEGKKFIVEKKKRNCDSFTNLSNELEDITKSINTKVLYSAIDIGYKTWQGDVDQSVNEYCSIRYYDTEYNQSENKLDLMSDFIASKYAIEKCINSTEQNYNDSIFMIWAPEAETDSFNYHFTPARMLNRHLNYLKASGNITFTGGEGNFTLSHTDNDPCEGTITVTENQNFAPQTTNLIEGFYNYEITLPFTVSEYCRLKKCIQFIYCGEVITAKIIKKTFSIGENFTKITIVCNGN